MQIARTIQQLPKRDPVGTLWIPVRNSQQIIAEREGSGLAKVSLHLDAEHVDLLDRYAAMLNSIAEHRRVVERERGEKPTEPKRSWTRKSLAEEFLFEQVEELKKSLAEQVKALGEIPPENDVKAVEAYAKRVFEWREKKLNRG